MRAGKAWKQTVAAAVAAVTLTVGAGVAVPSVAGADDVTLEAGDRCYIGVAHVVFLDRPATNAELFTWSNRFINGTPRSDLPMALANSDEWLSVVVTGLYQQALDRDPDTAGRAFWIGELRRGVMVNRIASLIYGSGEFYANAGGTTDGFIRALYTRILHRPADAAGLAYWRGQVAARGRGAVAALFFASTESRGDRVDTLYTDILGRPADPSGRAYWIDQLARVNDVRLAVLLASSSEFHTRAQTRCTLTRRLTDGNDGSYEADISADGRYVAFSSPASSLTPGDTNGRSDIFVRDRVTGTLTRVTRSSTGGLANGHSYQPSVTDDGEAVIFTSYASNLVAGDTNGQPDIYGVSLRDGLTVRLTAGNGASTAPDLANDGELVTFQSTASNLVPGDTNGQQDVFVVDAGSREIVRLTNGNGPSGAPSISDDGSFVAFESGASNLVAGDTNGNQDVFRVVTDGGATTRLTNGNLYSAHPAISGNGAFVAFDSPASNLVPDDTNARIDIFVWSPSGLTAITEGIGASYTPSISDDGRYVTFHSDAQDLVAGDTNGQPDVFRFDRFPRTMEAVTHGNGRSQNPAISADGHQIAFPSFASNLVADDSNGFADVFVWTDLG
ncbi:MAG: DUF4214 domain-containing protein [Iamia sp.]